MANWHLDDEDEQMERSQSRQHDLRDRVYGRRETSTIDDAGREAGYAEASEELAIEVSFQRESRRSTGRLLSFYDRLRERIVRWVERKGGRASSGVAKALLLVPDVFILLVRLTLDREVPGSVRAMIGGALAYFLLPVDFLPEVLLGPVGFMDDLVLAVAVLAQAFGGELEPYARRHWSGPEDLRVVLKDISTSAEQLLGHRLYDRLRRFLGRRGVEMDDR